MADVEYEQDAQIVAASIGFLRMYATESDHPRYLHSMLGLENPANCVPEARSQIQPKRIFVHVRNTYHLAHTALTPAFPTATLSKALCTTQCPSLRKRLSGAPLETVQGLHSSSPKRVWAPSRSKTLRLDHCSTLFQAPTRYTLMTSTRQPCVLADPYYSQSRPVSAIFWLPAPHLLRFPFPLRASAPPIRRVELLLPDPEI
ncbi:uncharacterized protein BDZ99DRAFT_525819 [Mytilinidion resinicola]|uniref:Uncharacterized protein n=1 Tax=Mytilinidion resinicola TaxID=574789 RepID=A0A6A6Y8T3_9PEZI|nr:uncharacterized protein BDZ99DRAFT_525819 [Mytilinidion resinicola]KAF2804227.1 hypothetical protein BDZ99DRAFT_525819 [Mytilinidion resinicola]